MRWESNESRLHLRPWEREKEEKQEEAIVHTEKGYNKELLDKFDDLKEKLIIAGGLNKESLAELESLGIKKVLIGTSLHSGEVKILD